MIGLDYLMAAHLMTAISDTECKARKTPSVTVTASDTSVRYDHGKSQAQLDNFKYDTVSPYSKNVQTHVGGLMAGEVSISQNMRIMQETYPAHNIGCLSLDSVKVKITITPTIYIASDYPKSGCMYKAIMEHEKKHVAVDRDIVAKYKPRIEMAVEKAIKELGYAHGPYSIGQLPAQQDRLQTTIQAVVRGYSKQMGDERQKQQQEVDTLSEYERVQAQCRGKETRRR